ATLELDRVRPRYVKRSTDPDTGAGRNLQDLSAISRVHQDSGVVTGARDRQERLVYESFQRREPGDGLQRLSHFLKLPAVVKSEHQELLPMSAPGSNPV